MDTVPGLREAHERQRELLLESELNRQAFRVEFGRVRCRVEQYRRGFQWAQDAWRWAAPLAGFLVARRLAKRTSGIFAKGSRLATLARSAWKIWDIWRSRPSQRSPTSPS